MVREKSVLHHPAPPSATGPTAAARRVIGAWERFCAGRARVRPGGAPRHRGSQSATVATTRDIEAEEDEDFDINGSIESAIGRNGDSGTVETSLTSVYPYARASLTDKVSAWGLVGMGSGELTLRHGRQGADRTELTTDIAMHMGAVGVRDEVLAPAEPGGLAVAVKSDAFWVETESEEVRSADGQLGASEGEATRVRLIVEGSRAFDTGNGTLTPSPEIGVRHDGGDSETGAGLEVGGALRFASGSFSIEGKVSALVAHEASGYEEWGAAGAVRIAPGASGCGLWLTVAPSAGTPASGTGALTRQGRFEAGRQLETEVGYGVGAPRAPGLVTPYAGLSLGEGGNRA